MNLIFRILGNKSSWFWRSRKFIHVLPSIRPKRWAKGNTLISLISLFCFSDCGPKRFGFNQWLHEQSRRVRLRAFIQSSRGSRKVLAKCKKVVGEEVWGCKHNTFLITLMLLVQLDHEHKHEVLRAVSKQRIEERKRLEATLQKEFDDEVWNRIEIIYHFMVFRRLVLEPKSSKSRKRNEYIVKQLGSYLLHFIANKLVIPTCWVNFALSSIYQLLFLCSFFQNLYDF